MVLFSAITLAFVLRGMVAINYILETCEFIKTQKMEKEQTEIGEIEETVTNSDGSPNPNPNPKTVTTKVPQVEIHLFRQGKGPIGVFKTDLAGWEQDQLEVRDILEKYGFKSLFAFNPGSGRGVPIRFHPRNGRSLLPYKDGSVVYVDGEPKVRIFLLPITCKLCFFFFLVAFRFRLLYCLVGKKILNSKTEKKKKKKNSNVIIMLLGIGMFQIIIDMFPATNVIRNWDNV